MLARGVAVEELELLYRRDLERFVRAASAIVGDDALAHDAVHDAFVSAVRARTSFRGGSLEGWVWRIVVNAATEIRRSQREDLLSPTSLTSTIARSQPSWTSRSEPSRQHLPRHI